MRQVRTIHPSPVLSCLSIHAVCVSARTHAYPHQRLFVRVFLEYTTDARTQRDIVPTNTRRRAPAATTRAAVLSVDVCSILHRCAIQHQRVRRTLGAHHRRAHVPGSSRSPRPHVRKQRHLSSHATRVLRHGCLGHRCVLQRSCHRRRRCRQAAGLPRSGNARADESRRHKPADLCADNGAADDCVADCLADDRVADYRVANPVSDFVADCTADLQSIRSALVLRTRAFAFVSV
jgi:hypothetical protein